MTTNQGESNCWKEPVVYKDRTYGFILQFWALNPVIPHDSSGHFELLVEI